MKRYVILANIEHYEALLREAITPEQRVTVETLLTEERFKQRDDQGRLAPEAPSASLHRPRLVGDQ